MPAHRRHRIPDLFELIRPLTVHIKAHIGDILAVFGTHAIAVHREIFRKGRRAENDAETLIGENDRMRLGRFAQRFSRNARKQRFVYIRTEIRVVIGFAAQAVAQLREAHVNVAVKRVPVHGIPQIGRIAHPKNFARIVDHLAVFIKIFLVGYLLRIDGKDVKLISFDRFLKGDLVFDIVQNGRNMVHAHQDPAVLNNICFAFRTQFAHFPGFGFTFAGNEIIIRNDFGPNKSLFKIGMNNARRLRRRHTVPNCPSL